MGLVYKYGILQFFQPHFKNLKFFKNVKIFLGLASKAIAPIINKEENGFSLINIGDYSKDNIHFNQKNLKKCQMKIFFSPFDSFPIKAHYTTFTCDLIGKCLHLFYNISFLVEHAVKFTLKILRFHVSAFR